MNYKINLEQSFFSKDNDEIIENLYSYFNDQTFICKRNDNYLLIENLSFNTVYYRVDSLLEENINKIYSPITLEQLPFWFLKEKNYFLCFNDNWCLYSWSQTLQKIKKGIDNLILIHLDSHDDIMNPRIFKKENKLYDVLTQKYFNILDSESVFSALESYAISIGSYITPLLHSINTLHIRHLLQVENPTGAGFCKNNIEKSFYYDLLCKDYNRIGIEFLPYETDNKSTYFCSDNLEDLLSDIPEYPTLLHIDLDYFNNRYNGNTDWNEQSYKHDPSITEIKKHIKEVFNLLHKVKDRIIDVSIGLSPGFCPSELWVDMLEEIKLNLKNF